MKRLAIVLGLVLSTVALAADTAADATAKKPVKAHAMKKHAKHAMKKHVKHAKSTKAADAPASTDAAK